MSNYAIERRSSLIDRRSGSRGQGGAVLAVVLVVLVAMMLGGVSLLSSVDTSALLSGNIGFKRHSVNSSGLGLNDALNVMKNQANFRAKQESITGCPPPAGTGTACSDASVWTGLNFYPRLLETDENGVPVVLKDKSKFDSTFKVAPVTTQGNQTRFLIERMCNSYGPSTQANCMLSAYSPRGGTAWAGKPGSTASPLYRITVRTDGVRNSQTYAQWIVAFTEE
jgi:type IV pilus assembly protein PilX